MTALKKNKGQKIYMLLSLVYIIVYFFVLCNYGMGTKISNIRYYFLAAILAFSSFLILFKYKGKYGSLKGKKILLIIPLCMIILIASAISAYISGYSFAFRTYVQTALVLFPALYAFFIINLLDDENIVFLMEATFVSAIIAYFCESPHTLIDFFKYSSWKNLSLENNFMESNICAGAFLQLYFFFKYYCDYKKNKSLKLYKNISFIFNIICFKRLGILFALFVAVTTKFINFEKKVSKKLYIIISFVFCISTILYTKFVQGDLNVFNIDVYKLTTGRNYIMSLWKEQGYLSYGFGTSMLVIDRYLEMDLVQLYMELGVLVTYLFCFVYIFVSNNKLYSLMIMSFGLLNLLVSSSLPSMLTWVLTFTNITFLQQEKEEVNEIC